MAEFLVLTLAAPMASFGELAGHDRRGTRDWPLRSAVLGLLGAARGIDRHDATGQRALGDHGVAVAVHASGRPLRDWHTVQTVGRTLKRPRSRADALARAGSALNTTITTRDYRTTVLHRAAIWNGDLAALAEAIARPHFALWLGRKACPPAAPLDPRIVQAADPVQALEAETLRLPPWATSADETKTGDGLDTPWCHLPKRPVMIASDPWPGLSPDLVETRWDRPTDRRRWHFAPREVHVFHRSNAEEARS
jgi:CRISPR system Cascade subunit CasD